MMKHFLLTRYNIGLYGLPGRVILPTGQVKLNVWAEHRLRLFGRYTVPSVRAQKCQDFTWLIAVDYRTPEAELSQLTALLEGLRYTFLPGDMWGHGPFRPYLMGLLQEPCDLLTTRLDSDDALQKNHVGTVQDTARQHTPPVIIDPSHGYILNDHTQQCAVVCRPRYHFLSLFEQTTPGNVSTIMRDVHCVMGLRFPVTHLDGAAYWLEVCHEYNMGNVPPDVKTFPFPSVQEIFR